MALVKEDGMWIYANLGGLDSEGRRVWFPSFERFKTKYEAIKRASELYPNRELLIDEFEI